MDILHILYQSLPQISGSSIRSRDILLSQKEIGLNSYGITSPFQKSDNFEEQIDEVLYYRSSIRKKDSISDHSKSFILRIKKLYGIITFTKEIRKIIEFKKPDVLHAHAMFVCCIPALYLGKKYKIPVVYEVRSLWMLNKEKSKKSLFFHLIEKVLFNLEIFLMKKVDLVVAINSNLAGVLVDSGVNDDKIIIVPNAVNTSLINSNKKKIVNESDGLVNVVCFGYIGTLTPHEGIDLLIRAFNDFNNEHENTKLLIYGKGIESEYIKQLSSINTNIQFMGGIEPQEVYKAFAKIDVIVNPRYKNKLTDSVTPLKPLEAMAYEKLFIGSNVGGIKELVTDRSNGFLFNAGDETSLVKIMKEVVEMDSLSKSKVKENALLYVMKHKSWLVNADLYKENYKKLVDYDEN